MAPTQSTLKQLFGVSGNECAFLCCGAPLIHDATDTVVGEVGHIRSGQKNGPRYDPEYPEDQIEDPENLLLCQHP